MGSLTTLDPAYCFGIEASCGYKVILDEPALLTYFYKVMN